MLQEHTKRTMLANACLHSKRAKDAHVKPDADELVIQVVKY